MTMTTILTNSVDSDENINNENDHDQSICYTVYYTQRDVNDALMMTMRITFANCLIRKIP